MGVDIFLIAVVLLIGFAILDLVVGVSNDAVNFLNSAIGSRVAPRYIIMAIASLGIIAGVSFSSGMMEVARKGIFHPQFFTMPELMTIFLAVMITDIILLDLFNTYGLPTSTTVSIVFELLGGAVAVSVLKILQEHGDLTALTQYINTSKALLIIFGILLSVVVAFFFGAIVQFLSRLLFTFDYVKRMKRFGALWGGMALAFITYFILIKGAGGATFITPESAAWIKGNAFELLLWIFAGSAVLLQILHMFKINILKPIVLVGTFSLAMAFAANDLVNFIGVPMAGFHSYIFANATDTPLLTTMGALGSKVPTETYMILIAGLVMVVTLWISRKARTVTDTELNLGQQHEDTEVFESAPISRGIVRIMIRFFSFFKMFVPSPVRSWAAGRLDTSKYRVEGDSDRRPSFDLLRASVNMMVASAVISYATSQKLPLSTTYVTFMVAMGTSFADLAWGRDSAVYRITGVLTVIAGWFVTALFAFTLSGAMAVAIFYGQVYGVIGLIILATLIIWKNHAKHSERSKRKEMDQVFNLKKVTDANETISISSRHMGILLREIRLSLDAALDALFAQNIDRLNVEMKKTKKLQRWANIIIANVFKSMRLLQKEHMVFSHMYGQTVRRVQKVVDGHRDIVTRAYSHISNHHKGLLDVQIMELQEVKRLLSDIIQGVETDLGNKELKHQKMIIQKDRELRALAEKLNRDQIERIQSGESKTRLSILFYDIVGNAMMLSKQNLKLMEIFAGTFGGENKQAEFDMD
jgi:hypothetical protein